MTKKISVPLPLNVSAEEMPLFQPYSTYELAPQKIKTFKNVFVAFSGFCMNHRGLIKECHHNYPFQHNYYLNEVSQYYYDVQDNPENLITLDDERIYLAIHHPWFNYYHWICESIFRLWMARDRLHELTLLLPEYYRQHDFIMGSLEPFAIKQVFFIPNGKSLLVKNLCLPQVKQLCDSYNKRHLLAVNGFYRNYIMNIKKISFKQTDRLYVSRELASRRKIINEADVLPVIARHGFTVFYPEQVSFLEQVAVFSQVRYLVGTHGSGLTNLLFMSKGTSLLELHQNKTNELDHPSPLFWYMADVLGVHYYRQSCSTHGREDYFEGDYIVDVESLEKNLKLMLTGN